MLMAKRLNSRKHNYNIRGCNQTKTSGLGSSTGRMSIIEMETPARSILKGLLNMMLESAVGNRID